MHPHVILTPVLHKGAFGHIPKLDGLPQYRSSSQCTGAAPAPSASSEGGSRKRHDERHRDDAANSVRMRDSSSSRRPDRAGSSSSGCQSTRASSFGSPLRCTSGSSRTHGRQQSRNGDLRPALHGSLDQRFHEEGQGVQCVPVHTARISADPGEEARIVGRVDLDEVDDRHEAARSQDCSGPVGLCLLGNPVVGSGGEHGVGLTGLDLHDFEVTDFYA